MLWRLLSRLLLIPFALLLSMLTAACIMSILSLKKLEALLTLTKDPSEAFVLYWESFEGASHWFPNLFFVPLLTIILIGEIFHIRSLLYYIVGFGIPLGLLTMLLPHVEFGIRHLLALNVWQVFVTAGFAAGFMYWLVAGRTA